MAKFDIQSLNLYYGTFQALKGVDLAIGENEITAFIGPSGCGKSTLLKTLDRMNDLVPGCRIEGKVLLDGEDIYDAADSVEAIVSYTAGDVTRTAGFAASESRYLVLE